MNLSDVNRLEYQAVQLTNTAADLAVQGLAKASSGFEALIKNFSGVLGGVATVAGVRIHLESAVHIRELLLEFGIDCVLICSSNDSHV